MLGLALIALLIAFAVIGRFFAGWNDAFPLSAPPSMPPDGDWIFGTDADGRDLFAVIVYGTLLTLKIGVIAGCLGLAIGTTARLRRRLSRRLARCRDADRGRRPADHSHPARPGRDRLRHPSSVNTTTMGIIIALLAWREPARHIRSQVLVMREAQYVKLAILNGASALRIIFLEMMPNLLPFLGANLVVAISQAVLASIGLEALGLGAPSEPTLGQTIYWMMNESAFLLGMWWWIIEPIAILIVLFVGLFLLTAGLDEIANPRLRIARKPDHGPAGPRSQCDIPYPGGAIRAVDSVSFEVARRRAPRPGRRIRLRQDDTALALMQMLRARPLRQRQAVIDGTDLLALSPARMREHRLRTISYIPQGAMNSLNPVHTVERQMRNAMLDHGISSPRAELHRLCVAALAGVGLGAGRAPALPA